MVDRSKNVSAEWLKPPVEEEGLRRYVETIRERIWLVMLAVAITTGVAVLYVFTAPKTYEATADMLVSPIASDDNLLRSLGLIVESVDPTRDVETASRFVTNINVAEQVRSDLSLTDSARSILDHQVRAEPVAQSNIVAVTAEGASPEDAQSLANAFANTTVDARTARMREQIDAQLPVLETELRATPADAAATLSANIATLRALRTGSDPTLRVEAEADLPTSAASPKPLLSIFGGLVAGLVLGVGGAFASQILDPRLRREAQLRRLYRLPILARVPKESVVRGAGGGEPLSPRRLSSAGAEAYRTLRATLASSPNGSGSRVILVTSPTASDGKSTTAVNLASSLALAGQKVILIEADLRRPSLSHALEVAPTRGGVVSVLIENTKIEDALITTPSYGPNLKVLLADYEGGWIAELFSIPAAEKMIDDARRLADFVIIDSPPLNEVIDSLPLARKSDDVLMVVRLGKTKLDRIALLAELLAENQVRPAGFAVVGTPRPAEGDYLYYQGPQDSQESGGSGGGGSLFQPAGRG